MSSASVAVTRPRRSRTRRYARFERTRNHAVARAHQWQDEQGREREAPVEEKEDDRRAREHEGVLDQAGESVRHELVERLDVIRDAADDRAGAVPFEEAEREALEVPEETDAQVRERALPDPAREVGLSAREHEGCDSGEQERDDDDAQRAQVSRGDPVVHCELHEVGRQERNERVRDERGDGERGAATVGAGEADEHTQASSRLPPRPVFDAGRALVGEMAPRLPDLHCPAPTRGTPAHHPLRA